MRKILLVVLILITSPLILLAKDTEDNTHRRVGFNGALTSSDTWQLEFSYHYITTVH